MGQRRVLGEQDVWSANNTQSAGKMLDIITNQV
jgi:hypothetical protein